MLAGLPKGPTYYGPDRHPDRAQERLTYVLGRMQEDGDAGATALNSGKLSLPQMVAYTQAPQRGLGLLLPRPCDPRSPHPRRRAVADDRPHHGAQPPSGRTCSTPPKRRCRKAWHNTRSAPAAPNGTARRRTSPTRCGAIEASPPVPPPAAAAAAAAAPVAAPDLPAAIDLKPSITAQGGTRQGNAKSARGGNGTLAPGPGAKTGNVQSANAQSGIAGPVPLAPAAPPVAKPKPAWQQALEAAHLPLYDVHWSPAIVLSGSGDPQWHPGRARGRPHHAAGPRPVPPAGVASISMTRCSSR